MIIGARPAKPAQPPPAAADETLPPIEFLFASGNVCKVTPAMRRDRKEPGKCKIIMLYEWARDPEPDDQEEIEASVAEYCGGPPAVIHKTLDRQEAIRFGDEFLDPGKRH